MILILLSILIIILGLIRPSMVKMRSRKNALLSGFLLFIISFVLFGITAPDETEEVAEPKTKQTTEDKEEAERLEEEEQEQAEKEKAEAEAQKAKELEEQKAKELEEQKKQEELAQQQAAAEEEKRRAEEEAALKAKQEEESKAQAPTPTVERFKNCTEMRKVHPHGVPSTHPAYEPKHDRDKDNHACEQ